MGEIAPKVYDHLVDLLRDRLVDEIYDQVEQQTVANEAAWVLRGVLGGAITVYMRRKIRNAVNEKLTLALSAADGRAGAIRYLGLGLAGLVAGAMHDAENRDGLMVISGVDLDPWRAFGDGKLDESSKHKQQVETAVAISLADLDLAYKIGLEQHQQVFTSPSRRGCRKRSTSSSPAGTRLPPLSIRSRWWPITCATTPPPS